MDWRNIIITSLIALIINEFSGITKWLAKHVIRFSLHCLPRNMPEEEHEILKNGWLSHHEATQVPIVALLESLGVFCKSISMRFNHLNEVVQPNQEMQSNSEVQPDREMQFERKFTLVQEIAIILLSPIALFILIRMPIWISFYLRSSTLNALILLNLLIFIWWYYKVNFVSETDDLEDLIDLDDIEF